MIGLDLIGAGEGLASQTIMVRVKRIDADKLRESVAGKKLWGGVIPMAISAMDSVPEYALGAVLPVAKAQLADIGITADLSTTKSPPSPNAPHEGLILLSVGAVLGAALAFIGRAVYARMKRG